MSDELENIHDKLTDFGYALDFQKQLNKEFLENDKVTKYAINSSVTLNKEFIEKMKLQDAKLRVKDLEIEKLEAEIRILKMQIERLFIKNGLKY